MRRSFVCLYISTLFAITVPAQEWEPVIWTTTTVTNTHYVCPCDTKSSLQDWKQWSSIASNTPATTSNIWDPWMAASNAHQGSATASASSMPGHNEGASPPKNPATYSIIKSAGIYTTLTEIRTGPGGTTVIYTMGPGDHTPMPCVPCANPTGITLVVTESVTQTFPPSQTASTSSSTSEDQVSATLISSGNLVSATSTSSGSIAYTTFTTSLVSPLLTGSNSLTTCRLLSTTVISSSDTVSTTSTTLSNTSPSPSSLVASASPNSFSSSTSTSTTMTSSLSTTTMSPAVIASTSASTIPSSTVSTTSSVIKGSPIFAGSSSTTTPSYITTATSVTSSTSISVTSTTTRIPRELVVDGSFENIPANDLYVQGYSSPNWYTSYYNGTDFERNNATTSRYTQFGNQFAVLFGRANYSVYLGQTIQGPEGYTTFQYFYRVSSFRGDADFNCTLYTQTTTRFTDTHDALTLTSTTDGLDLKNHTFVTPVGSDGRVRDLALRLACAQSPYDYGMDVIIDNVSVVAPTD